MATRPQPVVTVKPLSSLSVQQLRGLLAAERERWAQRLSWDLGDALELVEQAVRCHVLPGAAVLVDGHPAGYLSCHVGPTLFRLCGAHVEEFAPPATADLLVEGVLAQPTAADRRVEGQVTAFAAQPAFDAAFRRRDFVVVPRSYLVLDLARALRGHRAATPPPRGVRIGSFHRGQLAECGRVLVAAHAGGVEAEINVVFRDGASAMAYLTEIVVGPGCGVLVDAASSVATAHGRVVGFCFATMISGGVAHLPQVAVDPAYQGAGVGSRLLDRTLRALAANGAGRVTLSVSRQNHPAAPWYVRRGFAEATAFSAYYRDPR